MRGVPYFSRFPVRLKITLPYLFLVIVFSFGVAALASRIIFETVDERFTNNLFEVGKIATEAMVNEESRILATMRLLVNLQGVSEALETGDAETLRQLTLGAIVNHNEEVVEFLNAEQILVLSLRHKKGGMVEEYESATGGSAFSSWEIVQKIASGAADPGGDKFADRVKTDWGDYFYIAGPVFNPENKLVGVILIGKSLNSLARQIREETLAQVTFYGYEGEPIASTYYQPVALDPGTAGVVLTHQDENSYRRNTNRRDFEALEMDYGEILGPWEVRGGMDLGIIGVSLVKNTLITASLPTQVQIVSLITVTVLIIMLVGINLAAVITRPLLQLVKVSQVVAGGDLRVNVPVNSHDEIADLAVSFNQMIESLQQSRQALVESYDKTLHGWSKALELRDHETQGHSQRVADLTLELARRLQVGEEELSHIRRGAILHDIGKMGIPDCILLKEGPLTDEEWQVMRNHPQFAYDMLVGIEYLKPALDIPYCHHEKWNGSGYPNGLKGNQIPLAARLFAIVDVWDAITSDRPYRKRMQPEEGLEVIQRGSGSHFDPDLVELFYLYCVENNIIVPQEKPMHMYTQQNESVPQL
jgi:HD-GYP domain-containing protein (c-di-GMP phosphodiesterase class II)